MNYKIVARYIKNLDFNISKPEIFLSLAKDIAKYKFKIDITSNRFKDNIIEVQTKLSLEPKDKDFTTIKASVSYALLVEIDKDLKDKNELEQIILIEIPKKTYPDLRKTFIYIFEKSGFKEINIEQDIDFKKLYLSKKN